MHYPRYPSGPEMPASDADRDRTADVLQAAYVEGRLTADEFDGRLTAAAGAETYGDLAVLIADVPVGPLPWQRPEPWPAAQAPAPTPRSTPAGTPEDWRLRLSATGSMLLTCLGTVAVILLVLVVVAGVTLGGVSLEQSIPLR